jgi:hypothetical protein
MSHTPGPWMLQDCWEGGALLIRGIDPRSHPQASLQVVPIEDARLIAAAPDLLAALKAIVDALRIDAPGTPLNNHKYDVLGAAAHAAIAKAEGRS